MRAAVWNTLSLNPAERDDHYVLWLEWRDAPAGPIQQEAFDHHLQLDNTAPEIVDFELRTQDGTVVEPCGTEEDAPIPDELFVYAELDDAYFAGYRLELSGGAPPQLLHYPGSGWHRYWEGTPQVANLNETGTTPAGMQLLRTINMQDFGASYTDCCYELRLRAVDRALLHSFNGKRAYAIGSHEQGNVSGGGPALLTFAAAP